MNDRTRTLLIVGAVVVGIGFAIWAVTSLVRGVGTALGRAIGGGVGNLADAGERVLDGFRTLPTQVGEALTEKVGQISDGVSELSDNALGTITCQAGREWAGAVDRVRRVFGDGAASAYELNVVANLPDRLTNSAGFAQCYTETLGELARGQVQGLESV